MRTASAAAIACALLCNACAGYTKLDDTPYVGGDTSGPPIGIGGGGDAGTDAGHDAGTDAGPDAGTDAGCAALSRTGLGVIDGCLNNQIATASISVTASNCAALINMTTATAQCTGTASGASDSFTGACGGYPSCSSTSLPGTINCGSCSIVICDGGVCP
jgi:hypothetical protein